MWDIIQKNKRDLKRESSRESLREEQLQASRQASRQALGRHSVGAMPWRGLFETGPLLIWPAMQDTPILRWPIKNKIRKIY